MDARLHLTVDPEMTVDHPEQEGTALRALVWLKSGARLTGRFRRFTIYRTAVGQIAALDYEQDDDKYWAYLNLSEVAAVEIARVPVGS